MMVRFHTAPGQSNPPFLGGLRAFLFRGRDLTGLG